MSKELSRREFIKATGIVAGGAVVGATFLAGCTPVPVPAASDPIQPAEPAVQPAAPPAQAPAPVVGDLGIPAWLGVEPEIPEAEITETIETEVLVCGAGTGGMFAAAAAIEQGLKVLVIERNAMVSPVRDDIGAIGSRLQLEANSIIDKAEAIHYHTMYCANRIDVRLSRIWADESADAINWLENLINERGAGKLWNEGGYDKIQAGRYKKFPTGHSPKFNEGITFASFLTDYVTEKGAEIRFETPMVKLLRDGKKITGVIAGKSGSYVRINASKGVIIATGGYQQNNEMMNALQPDTVNLMPPVIDGAVAGDGIKACLWMGAEMDDVHTSMLFDRVALLPNETPATATKRGFFWIGSQPFMKVNANGERFANESVPYDYILHASSMQPGNFFISVFDSNYMADIERFSTVGCSRIYNYPNGAPPNIPVPAVEGMIQGLIGDGFIQQADTIEELAQKLNIPVDTFVKSVNRYNELYEAQEDVDFYKEAYRLSALNRPPYFGVRACASLLCTMDGIRIDTMMRPLDFDKKPFEGIHVIGDASGGYYAHTYPNFFTGHACGRTLTFARRVARILGGGPVDLPV